MTKRMGLRLVVGAAALAGGMPCAAVAAEADSLKADSGREGDVVYSVPGLTYTDSGGNRQTFVIRGVQAVCGEATTAARQNCPFGGTIAYGIQTMPMLTHLLYSAARTVRRDDPGQFGKFVNYGIEQLCLVSPVPAGSRIRARIAPSASRVDDRGRQIVVFGCNGEIEGHDRPALVGDRISLWLPPSDAPTP